MSSDLVIPPVWKPLDFFLCSQDKRTAPSSDSRGPCSFSTHFLPPSLTSYHPHAFHSFCVDSSFLLPSLCSCFLCQHLSLISFDFFNSYYLSSPRLDVASSRKTSLILEPGPGFVLWAQAYLSTNSHWAVHTLRAGTCWFPIAKQCLVKCLTQGWHAHCLYWEHYNQNTYPLIG